MRQIALLCCLFLVSIAQAKEFSSLEERMTAKEFREAGLDKLTPEELQALNVWLRDRSVAPSAGVISAPTQGAVSAQDADRRGFPMSTNTGDAIHSSIPGDFEGWSGRSGQRFTLANGQIWETTSGTRPFAIKASNPTVVIESGMLGAWYMRVDGYNARASVKRVK